MRRLALVFILSGVAVAQNLTPTSAPAGKEAFACSPAGASPAVNFAPDLPPSPKGKTTVIGGAIRNVDRLQDKLTLNVYGGRDMKIFFDARTEIYRDGQRVALSDLKPGERISVETLLDGEAVFARSIHMLTQSLDGECRGQVVSFNRADGVLSIRDGIAPDAIKVHIPATAVIVGQGQETASAANLGPGALVDVTFASDGDGRAVARQVSILATPGTPFVFSGVVDFLDFHSGLLVIHDPRDDKKYEISFAPEQSKRGELREGIGVSVTAAFDGSRYKAQQITVTPAPADAPSNP